MLYPFAPGEELRPEHSERLRRFFAGVGPFAFDITRVAEFPGEVVYGVPEPDGELRAAMRALWALFPEHPPYGEAGGDPPPHATLARRRGPYPRSLEEVAARMDGLLPAHFLAEEVTLMEEFEPDRWRVRETFALGSADPR